MKRLAYCIVAFLVVVLIVSSNIYIHPIKAQLIQVVSINSDGSVTPSTAPIQQIGSKYMLNSDLVGNIVVLKNHVELDGANHFVYGFGAEYGIDVTSRTNVTIRNFQLQGFRYGIWLYESSNCLVEQNSVTDNEWMAITLYYSTDCTVSSNRAFNSTFGVWVASSTHNLVSNNCMTLGTFGHHGLYIDHEAYDNIFSKNNVTGIIQGVYMAPYSFNNSLVENNIDSIYVNLSENNTIVHNNFSGNHSYVYGSPKNTWDNGKEGNFWSDYNGEDANHEGIGDTPYILNANNIDNYPLMQPYSSTQNASAADFNSDGIVNFKDIVYFVSAYIHYNNYGALDPICDLNNDGIINFQDIVLLVHDYIAYAQSLASTH